MTHHILIADDDVHICEALRRSLRFEGFEVLITHDGNQTIREIESNLPSLLVLDINMPKLDGIQVIKYLRSLEVDLPICVLSARDQVSDRVIGLEVGADDYLVKPFAFEELLARVNALLRRKPYIPYQSVRIGKLKIESLSRKVTYHDIELDLTKKEFDLLHTLAMNSNIVLSRDRLLDEIWGYDFEVTTNVVDVFVGYLRRKMESSGNPRMIETVRGIGFVLKNVP